MWTDESKTVSTTNFTCLIGIPLSDQSEEGCGNVGLLPGGCHAYEELYQRQREAGTNLGPEGLDWPRVDFDAPSPRPLPHEKHDRPLCSHTVRACWS